MADALGVYLRRSGLTAKALYEAAGMSAATYHARAAKRTPYTLNDVDALSRVLGVHPIEVSQMAAKLGELNRTPKGRSGERV